MHWFFKNSYTYGLCGFWPLLKKSSDDPYLKLLNFSRLLVSKYFWHTQYNNNVDIFFCKKSLFTTPKCNNFLISFKKSQKQNLHFWIFSKNSFRNELQSPFLSYFDTQHSICEIFTFLLFGRKGVPGSPKNQKIFFMIPKRYFN